VALINIKRTRPGMSITEKITLVIDVPGRVCCVSRKLYKNSCEQASFIGQLISLMIYFKVACLLCFITVLPVRKGNDYGSVISEAI